MNMRYPHVFQKPSSHFEILGSKKVTLCKFHTKDQKLWCDF